MHPVSHQTLDHRLILFFSFSQLTGGKFEGACILQPLKFLRSLILTSDPEKTYEIGQKLGLPHVLFDLVQDAVENSAFIKVTAAGMQPSSTRPLGPARVCANCFLSPLPVQQTQSVPALGEILITLRLYWEKQQDWAKEEQRLGYCDARLVLSALNCMCVKCVATHNAFFPTRLQEFTRPLCTILHQPNLLPVAVSQNFYRV